ncbi:MAG TPA: copper-containing nitrite reductase [Candidatus Thalassarchaeaceae archaeon]|nr:copper-containing nitrite reductase [Candidatus Thalassarchaeaceae archaeon]HJM68008.1 copper-containing nitrite reductase [Candidatus Thalassarchaeaceae archaeon]
MKGRMLALMLTGLMICAPLLSGCIGSDDTLSCGEGTTLLGDECIGYNDVSYTLRAENMAFIGVGGSIDGITNPDLPIAVGDRVTLTLIMSESNLHDVTIEYYNVATSQLTEEGSEDSLTFIASAEGTYAYYCSIPGHRAGGMEGNFIIGTGQGPSNFVEAQIGAALDVDTDNIARDPLDIPPPTGRNETADVHIYMEAVELVAEIQSGTTFTYWTYNGTVPGPMFRARVGDTVFVHFSNLEENTMHHNVDFHSVTGQGGGAAATETAPGTTSVFSFKAMHPGLFVYHCATPDIPTHISKGMYGMMLIEPEIPLPPVDKEVYIMQGDIYTKWRPGTEGHQEFDDNALFEESPTYVVFNGKFATFTGEDTIQAEVGETMRIYFGVGGPNTISSFHLIGEIFDRVYNMGDLVSEPMQSVQTIAVVPGGAVVVDVTFDVPANYILVDHALTRAFHKGAVGIIAVTGDEDPSVINEDA